MRNLEFQKVLYNYRDYELNDRLNPSLSNSYFVNKRQLSGSSYGSHSSKPSAGEQVAVRIAVILGFVLLFLLISLIV